MKIKIVSCTGDSWWYADKIGQEYDVIEVKIMRDGENYQVCDNNNISYILKADAVDASIPRLYEHEGVQYILPDYVKYVTCDGVDKALIGWANTPAWLDTDMGYQSSKGGLQQVLVKYIKPLPKGAFLVEV